MPGSVLEAQTLTYLDLSSNLLTGRLPNSAATGSSPLRHVDLHDNRLLGSIEHFAVRMHFMSFLDLEGNLLTGRFPLGLRAARKRLEHLNLDRNMLSGPLPSAVGELRQLTQLSVAVNSFKGALPMQLGDLRRLAYLSITHNHFTGGLPSSMVRLSSLAYMDVAFNELMGTLPPWLVLSRSLLFISMEFNRFSGNIPSALGSAAEVPQRIVLNNNNFIGRVPEELCRSSSSSTTMMMVELSAHSNPLECYADCLQSMVSHLRMGKVLTCRRLREQQGLCDFVAATNIASLTGFAKWKCSASGELSSAPCASASRLRWKGIICGADGDVVGLNLRGIGLTGVLSR